MTDTIRQNNIRKVRKALGLKQRECADMVGLGVPQISRWEHGMVDIPVSKLKQLAAGMGIDVSELLYVDGPVDVQALIAGRDSDERQSNAHPFRMEGASLERLREDLPIYGSVIGATRRIEGEAIEQTYLNSGEVIGYARRPTILNGNTSAYGVYVTGSSMEPRYFDGELLLIDPKGRIHAGEDVIVYLRPTRAEDDDGDRARAVLVKRLVRRGSEYVELQQYNPASTFRIETSDVVRIDRVIPWQEMIG